MSGFCTVVAPPGRVEDLLCSLKVQVDAFAVCDIGEGQALAVPPLDDIVVHYVLSGTGSVQWAGGSLAIEKGSVALIPRNLHKQLAGPGPINTVIEASQGCALANGLQRFVTPDASGAALRLACATVSAELGRGLGLFDSLNVPRVERPDSTAASIFAVVIAELADPTLGTKAIIESSMKQILVRILRGMLATAETSARLNATLLDDRLVAVVSAILSNPGVCHSLPTLAKLAGLTPASLSQRFFNVFGKSPLEMVQEARMDAAKGMLLDTGLPVKSIAASVGFASRSHFSREFSKLVGQDPTKFRKSHRPVELPPTLWATRSRG